jgi:hypothetical protein
MQLDTIGMAQMKFCGASSQQRVVALLSSACASEESGLLLDIVCLNIA